MTRTASKIPPQPTPLRKTYPGAPSTAASTDLGPLLDLLAERVAERVLEGVAELLEGQRQPPALLDITATCEALGVSRPTLRALDAEGMPSIPIGESRRYELAACLEWLRARTATHEGRHG